MAAARVTSLIILTGIIGCKITNYSRITQTISLPLSYFYFTKNTTFAPRFYNISSYTHI